jgi:hypothetical protein
MAKLIRFMAGHRKAKQFNHPLLDGVKRFTSEELDVLASEVIQDSSKAETLILALRSCLRYNIGRYIANFPACRPYIDDMVSEGFLALSLLVDRISFDLLDGRAIIKVASKHIQYRINKYLNRALAPVAASLNTQKLRITAGEEPFYGLAVTNSYNGVEPAAPDFLGSSDTIEALNKLVAQDSIDAHILCPTYWGWSGQQLGELLGVDRREISRRRRRLLKEYRELTR